MGKQVDVEALRAMTLSMDKFRQFERETVGAIHREVEVRKEKAESARIAREKKAKRKRQRAAAGMA